jgi:stress response protein SCP2
VPGFAEALELPVSARLAREEDQSLAARELRDGDDVPSPLRNDEGYEEVHIGLGIGAAVARAKATEVVAAAVAAAGSFDLDAEVTRAASDQKVEGEIVAPGLGNDQTAERGLQQKPDLDQLAQSFGRASHNIRDSISYNVKRKSSKFSML